MNKYASKNTTQRKRKIVFFIFCANPLEIVASKCYTKIKEKSVKGKARSRQGEEKMAGISLKHINKTFSGGKCALEDFSLDADEGEITVVAGPVGSGCSTALRIICGLETPTSGDVYIDGSLRTFSDTKERDVALVTKEYPVADKKARVYDCLAYGLKLRKYASEEIDARVREAASLMNIEHLLETRAIELSLIDLRRVALCRTLVRKSRAVLLDNILDGLDKREKIVLITDIRKIKKFLGTAIVCAVNDGADAMTLGERVAVIKDGRLRQFDAPQWLYDNPADAFVATFLGEPVMNMVDGKIMYDEGKLVLDTGSRILPLTRARAKRLLGLRGDCTNVVMGIRAEDIHAEQLFTEASPETIMDADVRLVERLGGESLLYFKLDGKEQTLIARVDARTRAREGERINLAFDVNRMHFFDKLTGRNLAALPAFNMLDCRLAPSGDGSLALSIGGEKQTVPAGVVARLTDRTVIGEDICLAVPPDGIEFEPFEGSMALAGEVDFTVEYPRYTAVYVKAKGCEKTVVAIAPHEKNLSAGESVKIYISPEKQILCRKSGERLIVSRPVTDNAAEARVDAGQNGATAVVGKSKLKLVGEWKSGVASLRIPPSAVRLGKGENTLSALVLERDFTGERTVLYLRIDGFEPYFTAALNGAADVNVGEKIKISVDSEDISSVSVVPLCEYIKNLSK